jgi:hypothetical protein
MDPATGVLSGTPTFTGSADFLVLLGDHGENDFRVLKFESLFAGADLKASNPNTFTVPEFQQASLPLTTGGKFPYQHTVLSGTLPPGFLLDTSANLSGHANTTGTFQFTVQTQDSFNSPPQTTVASYTVDIGLAPLVLNLSLGPHVILNRNVDEFFVARGGVRPYTFAVSSGRLPDGLSLDPASGHITGTPTVEGQYDGVARVTDSGGTPSSASMSFSLKVSPGLGRNDTPATATRIGDGQFIASLSPYQDPPSNGVPLAADNDYYQLVAAPNAIVSVFGSPSGNNLISRLVLEFVDANGHRLSTCRLSDTSTAFNSDCLYNQQLSGSSPHLDFRGPSGGPTTFYAHFFDWFGGSRPDMTYFVTIRGSTPPLVVTPPSLPRAIGISTGFSQKLIAKGAGTLKWSVTDGALPPGMELLPDGTIAGTPAAAGEYRFTATVTDSAAQSVNLPISMQVEVPANAVQPKSIPERQTP